ncbi:MAG: outer membrane protein assembly factor BamB family protein [Actinomycetaceae bacterium]
MSDRRFRPRRDRRRGDSGSAHVDGYGVGAGEDPLDRWSDDVRRDAGIGTGPAGTPDVPGPPWTHGSAASDRTGGTPGTSEHRPTMPSGFRTGAPSAARWSRSRSRGGVSRGSRAGRGLTAAVGFFVLMLLVAPVLTIVLMVARSGGPPDDVPTATGPGSGSAPELPEVDVAWEVTASDLTGVSGAEVRHAIDASFDEETIVEVDGTWVFVVQDESSLDGELVGLDPETGETAWSRRLSHAMCARNPTDDGLIACLAATGTDDAGLGTDWDLQLVDPATGSPTSTSRIAGHLTSIYVHEGAVVLLDQPDGGTDVVLRGLDAADLSPLWETGLGAEVSDGMLAGDSRIITRGIGERGGAMLDRPRWRPVDEGHLALSAGLRTAVVDVGTGELQMSPLCTRFVTDGATMWCNEDGAGMRAYDRTGAELWVDPTNRMAAMSSLDPDDHLTPLVLDPEYRVLDYDLATGRPDSVLLDPGSSDTFVGPLRPSGLVVGEHTVVRGDDALVLLGPDRTGVVGEIASENYPDGLLEDEGGLVVVGDQLTEVDPATAGVLEDRRIARAERVEQVGDLLVTVGLDGLGLLEP